jgi:hypothetical protein
MKFRNRCATVALAPALLVSGLLIACSSNDTSDSSLTPFDSGAVTVPEAGPQPSPITVQVQGQGTVYSADAHPADGGLTGALVCTATSTPAQCTSPLRTTLYSVAAEGWVLSRWTTTGLASGVDLGMGASSYTVDPASPSPIIAIFVREGGGSAPDAGSAPANASDAGGDAAKGD